MGLLLHHEQSRERKYLVDVSYQIVLLHIENIVLSSSFFLSSSQWFWSKWFICVKNICSRDRRPCVEQKRTLSFMIVHLILFRLPLCSHSLFVAGLQHRQDSTKMIKKNVRHERCYINSRQMQEACENDCLSTNKPPLTGNLAAQHCKVYM